MEEKEILEMNLPVRKVAPMMAMLIRVCETLKENLNFNEKSKVQIEYDPDEPSVDIKVFKYNE